MSLCIAAKTFAGQVVTCYDSRTETPTAQADIAYKSRAVAPHWHLLMAGTLPAANELADIYEQQINKIDASGYESLIDRARDPLSIFRLRAAEHFAQTRFAVSHGDLMNKGREWFGDQLFKESLADMRSYIESREKEIQLLLVVTEDPGVPHIFKYSYGDLWECDAFAAIGSGETIAEAMLFQRGLTEIDGPGATFYIIYEAKRMAEITPGVGITTTMTAIGNLGSQTRWRFVSQTGLDLLERQRRRKFGLRPVEEFKIPHDFFSEGYGERLTGFENDEDANSEDPQDPQSPTNDPLHPPPSQE